jgi:hypothetical protein
MHCSGRINGRWQFGALPISSSFQSSAPLPLAIVDGMNVHESRVSNYPPRYNAAPRQDLLVWLEERSGRHC